MVFAYIMGRGGTPSQSAEEHPGLVSLFDSIDLRLGEQEAQLMLTTGSTRLAVSRGQQTWYHSTCYI